MSQENVIDFVERKLTKEADVKFLAMVDGHIESDPSAVKPIPASLFERMDQLAAKAERIRQQQLLEG